MLIPGPDALRCSPFSMFLTSDSESMGQKTSWGCIAIHFSDGIVKINCTLAYFEAILASCLGPLRTHRWPHFGLLVIVYM